MKIISWRPYGPYAHITTYCASGLAHIVETRAIHGDGNLMSTWDNPVPCTCWPVNDEVVAKLRTFIKAQREGES
jgi:hypothetical protein